MWPFTKKKHKEPIKLIHASHYKDLQEKTNHWIHKQEKKCKRKHKKLVIESISFAPVSDHSMFHQIKYRKESIHDEEYEQSEPDGYELHQRHYVRRV